MKSFLLVIGIASLAGVATPAEAQSFENISPTPSEVRIQVGIVIPLGSGGTMAERAPRVEAWSDPRQQRSLPQASLGSHYDQPRMRPVRVGVNFTGKPQLMLNGRELPTQGDKKGISTLGAVGIAAVVVVAIAVVAVSNTQVDLSS